MSNLPPLPVLCDTPPPIDDFSNIPDDDYVDFDGIGDDYDVVIDEPSKLKGYQATVSQELNFEKNEEPEDTPLPYLGTRLPPDGTDMILEFPGDSASGRETGLDLDSPASLHFSSGSGNDKTSDQFEIPDDDFVAKQVNNDNNSVLENVDACVTSPVLYDTDRHIEGGSDKSDELEEDLDESQLNSESNITQEPLTAQQSNFDIAFDDFTDFQSVPPDKCDQTSEKIPETVAFDVDFSNFQADFSEIPPEVPSVSGNTDEMEFDNFQDFSSTGDNKKESAVITSIPQDKQVENDYEDDDFGDFNDFQTTATVPPQLQSTKPEIQGDTVPTLSLDTFTKIVDLMFPVPSSHIEEGSDTKFDTIPFENTVITSKLKNIELSRALSYKYANSDASKTLMESIGIDSKNVLFGMKWNPGMPRYAANLSFDPIQPQPLLLQPTPVSQVGPSTSASKLNESITTSVTDTTLKQSTKDESQTQVPAAQFDWSSAGLVNPLDVSQAHTLLLDEIDAVVMATNRVTKFKKPNSANNEKNLQNTLSSSYCSPSSPTSSSSSSLLSFTKSINNFTNHTNNSRRTFIGGHHLDNVGGRYYNSSPPSSKPTAIIDPVSVTAASSHILTDEEKISSLIPSAASSILDDVSTTGTTQYSDSSYSFKSEVSSETLHQTPLSPTYGMSVRTITLPETHIFTPEKCTNAISQSVDREAGKVKNVETVTTVKEYHDVEYKLDKSFTSDCLSSINSNNSSENSVLNQFNSLSQPTLVPSTTVDPIIDSFSSKMTLKPDSVKANHMNYIKKDNFPIFGTSPTDMGEKKGNNDDDFSDFQAAPTVKPMSVEPIKPKPLQATVLLNPLPLSPVHLMRSAANSTLPEPDDDEMLRIEAFARSKSQKSTNNNVDDDDEWSDFTSAAPPSQPQKSITSNKNASHDDDWSDFVFTTPASSSMPPIIANHHRQTQQKTSNPSWNHQILQQGNYMPWSTSTGQTPINHIQFTSGQRPTQQSPGMPELNFVQSQKSFVNAPNRHQMMRK